MWIFCSTYPQSPPNLKKKTLFTIITIGGMEGIIIMDGHDPCSHDQPWHFDRKEGSQCKKLLAAEAAEAAAVIFSAKFRCVSSCVCFLTIYICIGYIYVLAASARSSWQQQQQQQKQQQQLFSVQTFRCVSSCACFFNDI